jgi:hypothetical protein
MITIQAAVPLCVPGAGDGPVTERRGSRLAHRKVCGGRPS